MSDSSSQKKELPPGYVCKICGSSEHSIHDCSHKISKIASTSSSSEDKTVTKKVKDSKNGNVSSNSNSLKIYLTGLPFDFTKPKLKDLFQSESCSIAHIQMVMFPDNPKKCKGVAFVTMHDAISIQNAFKLNGRELEGKILKVEKVVVKKKEVVTKPKVKRCFRCGSPDHEPTVCTNPRICYRCKSFEHLSSNCPKKVVPNDNPRKTVFT